MAAGSLVDIVRITAEALGDPINILAIIAGTLFGLIVGMIPGLGSVTALALVIPLTFGMNPITAFMLLAATKGGTNFGGSITSILINTPGSGPTAATILDGHPMAKQGRASEAIAASAVASALGAIVGIVAIIISIPLLSDYLLSFGPPELFLLGLWGLIVVAVVVREGMLPGLISGLIGMLIAMHGLNAATAQLRWSYGFSFMISGFKVIPPIVGLFAVAEMIKLLSEGGYIAGDTDVSEIAGNRIAGIRAVLTHWWVFLRSAVIGTGIGAIPGVGGVAANYVAYFQAASSSGEPEKFGTGDIRGVIASEASNDGKDGGALIPTLLLGIPGSAATAVLLGAFQLHGLQPGPLLLDQHFEIIAVIIGALLLSNLLVSVIGLVTSNALSVFTRIDVRKLAPSVIATAFLGVFAVNNNIFDVFIAMVFGLLGFVMIRIGMSRIPLVLALILEPVIENNFFRALQISETGLFVFARKPLTVFLLLLIIVTPFQAHLLQGIKWVVNRPSSGGGSS